ncbi:MAG: putative Ig domain-containing protein, partial [Candidatus Eremiobacteraeota bacterium]|nr:putative Ig domain-containing protein [Candidatus Eremiobacteraeota bacterium]
TKLKVAAVNVPYSVTLKATGGVPAYTWSITSGSLPAGLQLDPNFGVIYGTPTAEGTSNITIQLADAESPPVTVQQALVLTVGGSDARLSGNYVFLFRGINNGKQVLQAGTFVSDGTGNITSGIADIMSTSDANPDEPVTGTYTIDNTGHGTMTLKFGPNGSVGTGSYQIASSLGGYFSFIQNGDGKSTQYGAGIIEAQNTVPTDLSNSKGNWVFGGYGADASDNRYGAVGSFNLNAGSTGTSQPIQSGLMDSNDNGSVTNKVTFTGSIGLPDATTGRGTFSFSSGGTGIGSSFAYYYVDDTDFIAIETDKVMGSTPLILYTMIQQTSFVHIDNTILNGNGVTEFTAAPSVNSQLVSETSLGLWSLDAQGHYWTTFDDNTGGTLTQSKPSGTYSVDSSSGRATFTGLSNSPILYIAYTDRGFFLGTDAAVTYGEMEEQRPPNMTNASIANANDGGSILAPAVPSQTVEVDSFNSDANGHLTGSYDTSGPNGPMMGLTLTATYNVDSTSCTVTGTTFNTCGRFPLVDSNNKTIGIGYVVASLSPQRVVIMTTNSGPSINALQQ